MTGSAVIRRAGPQDAGEVAALRDDAARWLLQRGIAQWQPGEVGRDDVLGWMGSGRVYVARQDGAPVGAVRLAWEDQPVWGEQEPVAGYVHSLVVARSVAGTGLGRRLLEHVERVVAASGRPLLRLDCWSGNAALLAWYAAEGFHRVGERSFPPEVGWGPVALWEREVR